SDRLRRVADRRRTLDTRRGGWPKARRPVGAAGADHDVNESAGMATSDTLPATPAKQDDRLQKSSAFRRILLRPEVGAIIGALALWLYFAVVAGGRGFLSLRGTSSYLEVSAELGILAIAVA